MRGGSERVRPEENRGENTYHGDALDAQHERVRRQVPRIRQGVLFPELGEQVLRRGDGGVVEDKVAFKKAVQRATWVFESSSAEGPLSEMLGL